MCGLKNNISKNMDRVTKVLIGILVILIITLICYIGYIAVQDRNQMANGILNNEIYENKTDENEIIGNEKDEENVTNSSNNEITNDIKKQEVSSNTSNGVIGKEEQASNKENGGINPEETAINLAKEKWGETSKNYIFTVDQVEGSMYHIAVISNAQVIGYVDVNMETKEVTER